MGEPACESQGALSFWQPPNRGPTPGLEEKSSISCSVVHSEVFKRLYLILKSFETHLELIFEVPAVGQCEVIGLLCSQHSPACAEARPQELDLRICKSLEYVAGICQELLYREFSPVTLNPTSRPAKFVVPRSSRGGAVLPVIMGSGMGVEGPPPAVSTS